MKAETVVKMRPDLFAIAPERIKRANVKEWLTKPGLPADAPAPHSKALDEAAGKAAAWAANKTAAR